MSGQWRALLVKDDEQLNASIVGFLRKDGYAAQGAVTMAEAMRMLWAEAYDVVICDLQAPGIDSLEIIQLLSASHPDSNTNTRVIIVGPANSDQARSQALESGALAYLNRPLNVQQLREELHRLLQQTGFSASLDSFDLLDVIQIINMSRKSIALLVNIGLEERGFLGFREGELIYAEYGVLRGEEAFFALAAHKNGTVMHQAWNAAVKPNVVQPLSRLIMQALQYRARVAQQQQSGEQLAVNTDTLFFGNMDDDRPFQVLTEDGVDDTPFNTGIQAGLGANTLNGNNGGAEKEWWQQTGKVAGVEMSPTGQRSTPTTPLSPSRANVQKTSGGLPTQGLPPTNGSAESASEQKLPPARRDLPSWLTDQPTAAELPVIRPSSLSGTGHIPATPKQAASAEWQPPQSVQSGSRMTGPIVRKEGTNGHKTVNLRSSGTPTVPLTNKQPVTLPPLTGKQPVTLPPSPEWQPPQELSPASNLLSLSIPPTEKPVATDPPLVRAKEESVQVQRVTNGTGTTGGQRSIKRNYNYSALVAALQTLGYSVNGFIAAAVATLDGQPIAQVAVDDLDVSRICKHFSTIMGSVLQSLDQGAWGDYEDTVITSADRHILMGLVGKDKDAFQVLITTRESDPIESLNVMANVENAITVALQS